MLCRTTTSTGSVSDEEVAKFSSLSSRWWDPRGEFAPLHRLNALRVPLVRDVAASIVRPDPSHSGTGDGSSGAGRLQGLKILDIGCGGGLLSEVSVLGGR